MNGEKLLNIHLNSVKKIRVPWTMPWTCPNILVFFEIAVLSNQYHSVMLQSVYYNSQNVLHSTNAAKYTLLRLQN